MSYDIHLDDKYGQMNLVDIPAELAAHEPWFNQTLTTVNDSVVRLGIIEGDFHWHKHDGEDEFFLVLEGKLLIDFEDREQRRADAPARLHGAARRGAPHPRARGPHGDPHGGVGGSRPDGRLRFRPPVAETPPATCGRRYFPA